MLGDLFVFTTFAGPLVLVAGRLRVLFEECEKELAARAALGETVGGIAHELNQPLAAILCNA